MKRTLNVNPISPKNKKLKPNELTFHNNETALISIEKMNNPTVEIFVKFMESFINDSNSVLRLMKFDNFQKIAPKVVERLKSLNLLDKFEDVRLFQQLADTKTIPIQQKVQLFELMIPIFIRKNLNLSVISLIRIFIQLEPSSKYIYDLSRNKPKTLRDELLEISRCLQITKLPSLNKYLSMMISNKSMTMAKLLLLSFSSSPEFFPLDKDLINCFSNSIRKIKSAEIFRLLLNNTMFPYETSTGFLKELLFDHMLGVVDKQFYLDILKESLISNGRKDLLRWLSDEPCELVASALKIDPTSLNYYLELFPNLNLLRVGLELFCNSEYEEGHKIFESLQKNYPVDRDLVYKVVRCLHDNRKCYKKLEYLSTFPVLREFIMSAVHNIVQDIFKTIKHQDGLCLEIDLYKSYEIVRFCYDEQGEFVGENFEASDLKHLFESSSVYAKMKACSFVHTFIDDRDEIRSIKIAHSQILPDKLSISLPNYKVEVSTHKEIHQELVKLRQHKIFHLPTLINQYKKINTETMDVLRDKDLVTIYFGTTLVFYFNETIDVDWEFVYLRNQLSLLRITMK